MFEAVGKQVLFLKRLSMGTLQLDETLTPRKLPGTYHRRIICTEKQNNIEEKQ